MSHQDSLVVVVVGWWWKCHAQMWVDMGWMCPGGGGGVILSSSIFRYFVSKK